MRGHLRREYDSIRGPPCRCTHGVGDGELSGGHGRRFAVGIAEAFASSSP